jgi:hypothetical protein
MEYYHYSLPQDIPEKSEMIPDILFLSSMATSGIWDLFTVNPYIYSLFAEYLKLNLNYKKIPTLTNSAEIETLKKFYSSIRFDMIKDNAKFKDLVDFIELERSKYGFEQTARSARILNGISSEQFNEGYGNFLKQTNIYELSLFYYLYNLFQKKGTDKIIFKNIINTKDNADMTVSFESKQDKTGSVVTYKTEYKETKKYFKEYLNMLEEITTVTGNTQLIKVLNDPSSIICEIFDSVLKSSTFSTNDVIKKYIDYLKTTITSDVEYYSTIMSVLKTIKITLEQNEMYLDVSRSIPSIVNSFVFMVSSYLEEYDKLIEKIKPKCEYQFCLLTKTLLITIKNNITGIEQISHINYLLEEAVGREIKISKKIMPIEDRERLIRITEISKLNPVEIAVIEKPVDDEPENSDYDSEPEEEIGSSPAASAAFDDFKKKCVAKGKVETRFVKPELSSKIIELVTKKYPMIDRHTLELALNPIKHEVLCNILQLPADSEASLNDAMINEEILNDIFELPKLGGNIDYNKECQIM